MPAPRPGPPGAPGRARRPRRTPPAAAPRTSPACGPARENRCGTPPRRRRNGVTVLQLAGPLGSVSRVEGGYDAGPCGYNSFFVVVTAGLVSMSLAEESLAARRERAELPESGHYASSLACSKHNNSTQTRFMHSSIRFARLATHSGDLGDGRLAVIWNSAATCDDRGPGPTGSCKPLQANSNVLSSYLDRV